MDKRVELKIKRMTPNQARAIRAIVSFHTSMGSVVSGATISRTSGLTGNALGGTVSALERSGTIQPFGREGRMLNWELTDPDLIQAKKDNSKELLELIDKIAK